MLKITIEAADEMTLHRMLRTLVNTGKNEFAVDAVSAKNPPESEPELESEQEALVPPTKRRGRPPKAVNEKPAESPDVTKSPVPTRSEVIAALEKYAERNGEDEADGMLKARRVMAEISGVKNAALKDVDPNDYRKLVEALALA